MWKAMKMNVSPALYDSHTWNREASTGTSTRGSIRKAGSTLKHNRTIIDGPSSDNTIFLLNKSWKELRFIIDAITGHCIISVSTKKPNYLTNCGVTS